MALLCRGCISPLDQLRESVASLPAWAVLVVLSQKISVDSC
jgi:hypothetical protein